MEFVGKTPSISQNLWESLKLSSGNWSQKRLATENSAKEGRTSIEIIWLECCQNLGKNCYRKSPGRMLPVILPPPDNLFSLMIDITTISVNSLLDPLPLHYSLIQCQNPPEQTSVTCWLSCCLEEGTSALLWFLYWEKCWMLGNQAQEHVCAHTRIHMSRLSYLCLPLDLLFCFIALFVYFVNTVILFYVQAFYNFF